MKTSENMKDSRLMQSEVPCFWYSFPAAEFDFDGNLGQEKLNLRPVPRTVLTALACRRLGWIRVAIGRCVCYPKESKRSALCTAMNVEVFRMAKMEKTPVFFVCCRETCAQIS